MVSGIQYALTIFWSGLSSLIYKICTTNNRPPPPYTRTPSHIIGKISAGLLLEDRLIPGTRVSPNLSLKHNVVHQGIFDDIVLWKPTAADKRKNTWWSSPEIGWVFTYISEQRHHPLSCSRKMQSTWARNEKYCKAFQSLYFAARSTLLPTLS